MSMRHFWSMSFLACLLVLQFLPSPPKSCPWMWSIYVNNCQYVGAPYIQLCTVFKETVDGVEHVGNSAAFRCFSAEASTYMDHWMRPHQKCWLDLINIGGVQRKRLRYMRGVMMNHPDSSWSIHTSCRTSSSSGSFRILPMCRLAVPSKHCFLDSLLAQILFQGGCHRAPKWWEKIAQQAFCRIWSVEER